MVISEIIEKLSIESRIKRVDVLDRPSVEGWLHSHLQAGFLIEAWLADPSKRKPYFIWWQLQLITVFYTLWERDIVPDLALKVAIKYLASAQEMGKLWPSEEHRTRCSKWQSTLMLACDVCELDFPSLMRLPDL